MKKELTSLQEAFRVLQTRPKGKAVHRLRVSSRKLRVVLQVMNQSVSDPRIQSVRKSLKKLSRIAGRERELEVAEKDAHRYGIRLVGLREKQKSAQRKIVHAINQNKCRKISIEINEAAKDLADSKKSQSEYLKSNIKSLESWLTKSNHTSRDFHELRIIIKRIRYFLDASGRPLECLKTLQDDLGRAHDLEIFQKMGGKGARIESVISGLQQRSKCNLKLAIKSARKILTELNEPA